MPELQLAPLRKIIKDAGAERVSDKAAAKLREIIEKVAIYIGERAADYAKHAGRNTVKVSDIELAAKDLAPIIGK